MVKPSVSLFVTADLVNDADGLYLFNTKYRNLGIVTSLLSRARKASYTS